MMDDFQPDNVDGLPLVYQGLYRRARRELDVSDLINNPEASGTCRVLGSSNFEVDFDEGALDGRVSVFNRSLSAGQRVELFDADGNASTGFVDEVGEHVTLIRVNFPIQLGQEETT